MMFIIRLNIFCVPKNKRLLALNLSNTCLYIYDLNVRVKLVQLDYYMCIRLFYYKLKLLFVSFHLH